MFASCSSVYIALKAQSELNSKYGMMRNSWFVLQEEPIQWRWSICFIIQWIPIHIGRCSIKCWSSISMKALSILTLRSTDSQLKIVSDNLYLSKAASIYAFSPSSAFSTINLPCTCLTPKLLQIAT